MKPMEFIKGLMLPRDLDLGIKGARLGIRAVDGASSQPKISRLPVELPLGRFEAELADVERQLIIERGAESFMAGRQDKVN